MYGSCISQECSASSTSFDMVVNRMVRPSADLVEIEERCLIVSWSRGNGSSDRGVSYAWTVGSAAVLRCLW